MTLTDTVTTARFFYITWFKWITEKIINGLSKELTSELKAMSKAKDINEKEVHSRIVKNLCESLGVFFDLASEMAPFDFDGDSDKEEIPF